MRTGIAAVGFTHWIPILFPTSSVKACRKLYNYICVTSYN